MHIALILLAVFAGTLIPAQAGFNAEYRSHAGHPVFAAGLNFLVGLLVFVVLSSGFVLTRQAQLPSTNALAQAPWWSWIGGLCGATMVFIAILAARPLGAAALIACLVTGQLVSSVVIDHFGLFNYERHPVSPMRLGGVALLVIGLTLILAGPKPQPSGTDEQPAQAGD